MDGKQAYLARFTRCGWRNAPRVLTLACLTAAASISGIRGTQDANANGETRSLDLYHAHTRESLRVTFKRDGSFDSDALRKLNWFLRDWRHDEETSMSPRLFDILWYVYREVGAGEPIKVVSAYRSSRTNEMLRRRSRAVAKESQHINGNAVDFHIPGVSMGKVRELAMRLQRGGVGYYPTAGSPFVHLDVGTVRSWPRMSREQLERLFPDGKTVHLPRDGVPLANYQLALAEVQARGDSALDYNTVTSRRGASLWALLFGGNGDEGAEDSDTPSRQGRRVADRNPRGRNAPPEQVASLPGTSDDVMRAGVVAPVSPARRTPPVEQVLRPQPGTEPVAVAQTPANATPAASATPAPAQSQPVLQVAALPVPPIRPRGLTTTTEIAAVNEPLPPIRPQIAGDRALLNALAETVARKQGNDDPPEPKPQLVAGVPSPPQRPVFRTALAETPAREAAAPAQRVANAPVAPAATAAPQPRSLLDVLAGARLEPTPTPQGIAQGFAAEPPKPDLSKAGAAAVTAVSALAARKPENPIATRKQIDPAAKRDMKPAVMTEPAAARRPDYVVSVNEPVVDREIRSGVMAMKLTQQAPGPVGSGFTGGFIRPLGASFLKHGE